MSETPEQVKTALAELEDDNPPKTLKLWVCRSGAPAFIYAVHGYITREVMADIEAELLAENAPDGDYLYVANYFEPQIDEQGRIEIQGSWELTAIKTLCPYTTMRMSEC